MNSKQLSHPMIKVFHLFVTAALLAVLVGSFLVGVFTAHARDIPFPTKYTLDANFDTAKDVYAADLDNDGDLDILGAAYYETGAHITWWENTGGGWTSHGLGDFYGAKSVYAADVNGDGYLDILGAAYNDKEIAWWKNDGTPGDGGWTKYTVAGSFDGAASVYAADIDGDGDLDILGAAVVADDITWWENDGTPEDGGWTEHTVAGTYDGAISVYAADVDGDGDLDILGAASIANAITWWENGSTPTDWAEHTVDGAFSSPTSVYAADVDGDGDLDILGSALGPGISWWENGNSWAEHSVPVSFVSGGSAVYAADMDSDGDLDILGASGGSTDDIAWLENTNGSGTSWSEHTVDGSFDGANSVYAADVDGDGDLDILGTAETANDIAFWENDTIHRSAYYPNPAGEHTISGSFNSADFVQAADIDHDGDLDILGAGESSQDVTWWANNGSGSSFTAHTINASFERSYGIHAADVNGDGYLDVIGGSSTGIDWWQNDGTPADGGWTKHTISNSFPFPTKSYAADLDGDGDLDVLSASVNDGDIIWWANDGSGGGWSEHIVNDALVTPWSVYAADLDGDGDLDVIGGDGNDLYWWANDGSGGGWSEHVMNWSTQYRDAQTVSAADLDGDGDLDILAALNDSDTIAWWENTGTCTGSGGACDNWPRHDLSASFTGAYGVYAADLDQDGDLDVVGAADTDNLITWWENDGTPTDGGWTEHTVDSAFAGARAVVAADLDRDGDLDIVGAAHSDNDVTWWENMGGQFALATSDTAPAQLASGQVDDVLRITMTHNGRSGDTDEELVTLQLLFEESGGDPLTTTEANAAIENLYIYLDDGSGAFESGSDTLVATVADLSLSSGVQTVTFGDGDANVQVPFGAPRTYFVVVEMPALANAQSLIDQLQITHVTQSSSTAEDRGYDLPLSLEYAANTTSSVVAIPRARVWDGGGSTENWADADNWDSDSIAPRAIDPVRFDTTSGKDAVIGAAAEAAQVTIASYGGQITQNAGLTVAGDWTQDSGTFTGGSSTLDIHGAFNLSGGSFTAPSGLMVVSGGFAHTGGTFDPNGGRVVLDNTTNQTLATSFNDLYLNDGLLAYWKLDEGSGATAADSSGYGYDGTIQYPVWNTAVPATMDFYDPSSLEFDRTGGVEYMEASGTTRIDEAQELTLATWVRLASTPTGTGYTYMRFISLINGKAVLRYNDLDGTGRLQFYMSIGGSLYSIVVDQTWATDTWYHVAGTYDGSTMRLYLDGAEKDTLGIAGTVDTGDGVRLSHPSNTEALDGLLDDVRIYNRALSATEIQALADGSHPDTSIATTTLGAALDINGDLILNSGTLDASASNCSGAACPINIAGDFTRNGGVFTHHNGLVTFDGSSPQTLDVDTNGVRFYDVTVNSGATLVVQRDFLADGTLTNNGTLQQTKDIPSGHGANFLYMGDYGGLAITSFSGDMGATNVTIRGNQDCTTVPGETVQRCFDIAPGNTSGLDVLMEFRFLGSELSGNDCNALNIYHWTGSAWAAAGTLDTSWGSDGRVCAGESSDPFYSVRVKNVSDFSPFVLKSGDAPGSNPTAVTLARFTARAAGDGNGLVLPLALVVLGVVGTLLWGRRRRY